MREMRRSLEEGYASWEDIFGDSQPEMQKMYEEGYIGLDDIFPEEDDNDDDIEEGEWDE